MRLGFTQSAPLTFQARQERIDGANRIKALREKLTPHADAVRAELQAKQIGPVHVEPMAVLNAVWLTVEPQDWPTVSQALDQFFAAKDGYKKSKVTPGQRFSYTSPEGIEYKVSNNRQVQLQGQD